MPTTTAIALRIPGLTHPLHLYVHGEQDRFVSSQCSRALASAWSVPLVLHPAAGHDLPHDDPDWVIARLVEWAGSLKRA